MKSDSVHPQESRPPTFLRLPNKITPFTKEFSHICYCWLKAGCSQSSRKVETFFHTVMQRKHLAVAKVAQQLYKKFYSSFES